MQPPELIPHLFRTMYGKLIAVLSASFGVAGMDAAGDIASETFLTAMETWPYKGVPPNPEAWLYTVARNKAINYLKRNQRLSYHLPEDIALPPAADLTQEFIRDSQLKLLFVLCHPDIAAEAQVCLSLRELCGFSIDEIAVALLSNKATINKRLFRARAVLRNKHLSLDWPGPDEVRKRLDVVLRTIYLLFSEGYYAEHGNKQVREDLCMEAIKLNQLLLTHPATATHESYALLALMCFHASRLASRTGSDGEVLLYDEQDKASWDSALIEQGFFHLRKAAGWQVVSKYYLEACIAYWHTVQEHVPDKWSSVLLLYDALVQLDPSPLVRLNRIYAVWKVQGTEVALQQAALFEWKQHLQYLLLVSKLHEQQQPLLAIHYLKLAIQQCKNTSTTLKLQHRLAVLEGNVH